MITLVITGVGGPLGQALIKAARLSAIPCRVVGTDRTRLSVGLEWSDQAHVIASATEPKSYLADMRRVCATEDATLILPGSDSELVLLAEHAEELRAATGAIVVASAPEVLKIALDKSETNTFLEAKQLNFPRFTKLANADAVDQLIDELGFPLIAKPCRGSGSRGVVKVQSREEIAYLRTLRVEMILQEYLRPDDEEYTVAVYTQRDGKQAGSIALKRELVAGNTYRAWVDQNSAILAEAEAVVRALRPTGPCNVQLRLTSRGAVAFEINPRFSGTTAMRAHFGFNEVEMAARDFALGEPVSEPVVRPGVALRFWDEIYLPPSGGQAKETRALSASSKPAGVLRTLRPDQAEEWMAVLGRTRRHDFYFLSGYHALAEQRAEGAARLFSYEDDGYLIALPLVLRPIAIAAEPNPGAEGWHDATSVYGYAGPLTSHLGVPDAVLRRFHLALEEALREMRVVSVFSRLHPLLQQEELLAGVGQCCPGGQTISIDLTQPLNAQRAQYRGNIKARLNQLRRRALSCVVDQEKRHLPEFISIYYETMRRVTAQDRYFFEEEYFTGLAKKLGATLQLFLVREANGEILGGGLFTLCDGTVQYHLGGTRDAALKLSPTALMFDTVRLWANEQGARIFHLGGGVGGTADSLFQYKARFSERRHEFATWRWIIVPKVYELLTEARDRWMEKSNLEPASRDYFPAYRGGARPRLDVPDSVLESSASPGAEEPVLSA